MGQDDNWSLSHGQAFFWFYQSNRKSRWLDEVETLDKIGQKQWKLF